MVDTTWATQLWSDKQWTDVEILIGDKKLEAHRVVLSARSPVFKSLLSKIENTGKSTLTISADWNFDIVEHFLKFLYTGILDISASNKELLALADLFEVVTLRKMCQSASNRGMNVESITTSLIALI